MPRAGGTASAGGHPDEALREVLFPGMTVRSLEKRSKNGLVLDQVSVPGIIPG